MKAYTLGNPPDYYYQVNLPAEQEATLDDVKENMMGVFILLAGAAMFLLTGGERNSALCQLYYNWGGEAVKEVKLK